MDNNTEVLQSLAKALEVASEKTKEYLVGYAEGLLAGRAHQDSAYCAVFGAGRR